MSHAYRFKWEMPAQAGAPSHNVMIAIPTGHRPYAGNHLSTAATAVRLARTGIAGEIYLHRGNCHVDDVRNEMIRDFLETECTDLFFVDDDVDWRGEHFVRLLKAPGDIVAGIYPHRERDDGELTFPFHPGEGVREANEHGLFAMAKVPTGFMRLRRHVVEALWQREVGKGRKWWRRPQDRHAGRRAIARIVERGFAGELGLAEPGTDEWGYLSGDYVLCLKAKQLGFGIWAEIDMEMGHAGETVTTGHLGNHLRRQQGIFSPDFDAAVGELKAGKADLALMARLNKGYDIGGHVYSLRADALLELWRRAREAKAPVLEMGSGLSTLVAGAALEGTGQTLHVLECHLPSWRATARLLGHYGVGSVLLHYAPLIPAGPGDDDVAYTEGADLPEAFGLALVDGPYHSPQRTTALHKLAPRLRQAVLIVDDVHTCPAVMTMLRRAGHAVDQREGERTWAIATPNPEAPQALPRVAPLRPLIVSLTSHPPRFSHLHHALASLLNQDMRPDAVVLWLAPEEMAQLPESILKMRGLTIRQCENLRPYKKLIPALEAYPDAYIATADDDLVYPRSWLRGLVEAYRNPKEIVLRRGRKMSFNGGSNPTPGLYNSWPLAPPGMAQNEFPDLPNLFPTSCHGMLVPPGAMAPEAMDRAAFQRLAPDNDDIWWYWMGLRGGGTFRVIPGDPIYDLPTGADGLWSQGNRDGGNDRQIAAMIEAYGMPWAPAGYTDEDARVDRAAGAFAEAGREAAE